LEVFFRSTVFSYGTDVSLPALLGPTKRFGGGAATVLDCGTSAAPGGGGAAEARGQEGAVTAPSGGAAEARGPQGAVTAPWGGDAAVARGGGTATARSGGAAEARGQGAATARGEGTAAARGSGAAHTGEAVGARAAPLCALRAFAALLLLLCVMVTWKPPRNPIPEKKRRARSYSKTEMLKIHKVQVPCDLLRQSYRSNLLLNMVNLSKVNIS
jgi:hypothetical protein